MNPSQTFTNETVAILREAKLCIEGQRRTIEILRAKAEVVEIFGMALRANAPSTMGMTEDFGWLLGREADRIESAIQVQSAEMVARPVTEAGGEL